jgi:uncharacterized protein (TIGR02594 family)
MTTPIWLSVARMTLGIKEVAGAASNAVIVQWAKDIGAPAYTDDGIAWCAVWANRLMLACQLPMSGKGFDLLRARSFESWGVPLVIPSFGCVMTFRRPEGGHVGLYLGENQTHYCVLGGNQSDSVSVAWLAKERLTAMRWPTGLPAHEGHVWLTGTGPTSENES